LVNEAADIPARRLSERIDRNRRAYRHDHVGRSDGSSAFLLRPDDDGVRHGTLDGELGLIAQEHDAREPLQQRYARARRDAEREQTVGSRGAVGTDLDHDRVSAFGER
jgi:hypothetical protein